MNLGTNDRLKAIAMVQANANSSGQTRWLHMWGGVFWQSSSWTEGAERINPQPPPQVVDDGATPFHHQGPPGGFESP